MAPPQVDLSNKKQPLEDVTGFAEKVGVDKLPPLPPTAPSVGVGDTAVAVETGTAVAGRRLLAKKRCKALLCGVLIGAVIAVAIGVVTIVIVKRHHRHDWHGKVRHHGHHGDELIQSDGARHVIHITRDHDGGLYKLRAVLDYERKLAAFKDCDKNRCYIDKLHESYEDGCSRWREYRHHARVPEARPMRLVEPAMADEMMLYFGGPEVGRICSGIPTYFVLPLHPEPQHEGHHGQHGQHGHHSGEHDSELHEMDELPPQQPPTDADPLQDGDQADVELVYL